MNLFLENVNLGSSSGPNHFAKKLSKYLSLRGVIFNNKLPYDKKLTFIESVGTRRDLDMYLRLDGIYFNAGFDCKRMNYNIQKSYEAAKGVIFQTDFNKQLVFNWFGPHPNTIVINNGADLLETKTFQPVKSLVEKFNDFDNIWSCAASWHSFKRLKSNIEYFLKFSGDSDCLIVAGNNPDHLVDHPRIFYVGNLSINELYTVYQISDYFIHLAYLDHCPNVVIDARSFGCKIICSSSGGTKEVAGVDATIVQEHLWDFSFITESTPPDITFDAIKENTISSEISMVKVAKKYHNFIKEVR